MPGDMLVHNHTMLFFGVPIEDFAGYNTVPFADDDSLPALQPSDQPSVPGDHNIIEFERCIFMQPKRKVIPMDIHHNLVRRLVKNRCVEHSWRKGIVKYDTRLWRQNRDEPLVR